MEKTKEVYQELFTPNNSYFFSRAGGDAPFYLAIGIKGRPFEEDLVIPVTKEYLEGLTVKNILDDHILNNNEDAILENLQLGGMLEFDRKLYITLKKTFNQLKELITDSSADKEIYSEPLNFGKCELTGHLIKEKRLELDELALLNLVYVEIKSECYNYIKQYIVRFKVHSNKKKSNNNLERKNKIVSSKFQYRFGPFETQVMDYSTDKNSMIKIPVIRKRIDERAKWLPKYPDYDMLYLIFSPIRFLRFNLLQKRLNTEKGDKNKSNNTKPSIVDDIRENALLDGIWDYKDIEYLLQIDLLVENGIVVPTDFNYCYPPYATVYKAIKDGILIVGGIEHYFNSSKEHRQGHFITYVCNKKMGRDGTQVLIKARDEIGNTNKMSTCAEMDIELSGNINER